jgi:hypothetical protein
MRDTLIPVLKNLRMTWESKKTPQPIIIFRDQAKPFERIIIDDQWVG